MKVVTKVLQSARSSFVKHDKDPQIKMLIASGAIDPAVVCGLNPEHARLLGLAPPKTSQVIKLLMYSTIAK